MRVLRQFFFFTKRFHTHKKKITKSTKRQTRDFHSDVFYVDTKPKSTKSTKAQNAKQATFFSFDFFMRIKILSFLCT